jgi:DNA-binding MarR family transcriptional regulator
MFRYVPPTDNTHRPTSETETASSAEEKPAALPDHTGETSVEIIENVMRAAHRLRAILNTQLGQFELTDIRYSVLQAIRETASHGCSQKDLSNRLNQTESSISTLIERMRQSGLLYRLPSTVDRRRKVLLLSELGRETLAKADEFHSRRMASLLKCFSAGERDTFSRLLKVWADELTRLPADAARVTVPAEINEEEANPFSFRFGQQQKPAA